MQGRKTHEQFTRTLEQKADIPDPRQSSAAPTEHAHIAKESVRASEFDVSKQGMNQESEHNKHNRAPKGAAKH